MARILFLAEQLPYRLISGSRIRNYYALRHLATHHEVTLLSFVRGGDRPEDVAHLQRFVKRVHTIPMQRSWLRNLRAALLSLLTGSPAVIIREEIGAMQRQVKELLATGEVDIVHVDQIPMAQYGLLGQGTGLKRLLDQHDVYPVTINRLVRYERNPLKRMVMRREGQALVRYYSDVCRRFDHITFVTEEDRQAMLDQLPDRSFDERATSIPICVDPLTIQAVASTPNPLRVTLIGTMYWPPNIEGTLWFWEKVWAHIRAQIPEARLTVVGKNPPERIRSLDEQVDVDVPGYVEDLVPYLAETAVFVVPLLSGGGMRVKIVDAWCWGLPVVSTTIGAEGIAFRDGENILIADSPERFAAAVVRVLRDGELQARLRSNGRRWVEERYDWRRVYAAWDEVYGRLVRG
jgi:glycosyltransferase involved in cell wall biosynthesis